MLMIVVLVGVSVIIIVIAAFLSIITDRGRLVTVN